MNSAPLTIVTWLWAQPNYRSAFNAQHVNTLAAMVSRNMTQPHRFVCMVGDPNADYAHGLRPDIVRHIIPPIPFRPRPSGQPNCYRRLWAFSPEARAILGERFVSIDLDCVVTGPLDDLLATDAPFKAWGDTARKTQYNGSLWQVQGAGRPDVWEAYENRALSSVLLNKIAVNGMIGSDQAFISAVIGREAPIWTQADGVLSFRNNVAMRPRRDLPPEARIVFFHGRPDPWEPSVQRDYPWIRKHYRG